MFILRDDSEERRSVFRGFLLVSGFEMEGSRGGLSLILEA